MRNSLHPLFAALVAGALALSACADHNPVAAPSGPLFTDDPATVEEAPDSGSHTLWPSDVEAAAESAEVFSVSATSSAGPRIRIGVVPSTSSVTLGSAGSYEIRDKATGVLLMSGSNGAATVTLVSVAESRYRLQVMCGGTAAVEARKQAVEAEGYPTLTERIPACTRLYVGSLPSTSTYAQRRDLRNELIGKGFAGTDSFYRLIAIGTSTLYRVARGTEVKQTVNPVVVTSSSGLVTVNGKAYRDRGEARVNAAGTLAGINDLPMEQYLWGVVPLELGPVAYPEIEAQKAQAVAARTYAVAGLGKRSSEGYDLLATTTDQVYGGYSAEHPTSTAAINATAGVVATYEGRPISALYSSTSGGFTADNEEAFNSAPVAYLRGLPDAERGMALEYVQDPSVFRNQANSTSLRAAREGDFESDWARFHRWSFEWTAAEISRVISDFAGQPVGRVLAINVLERGPSGRVLRIEYVTEAGTYYHARDRIRSSLRFINASGAPTNLLSTLFHVEPVKDSDGSVAGFKVWGGGFGHGVGMSQTGAVGMAQKGHDYAAILKLYYRGIELATWY